VTRAEDRRALGMLHGYNEADKRRLLSDGDRCRCRHRHGADRQAPPIYGGTDQVQRNVIGERVLGLPKEPNNDRVTPFSELPKNA